MVEIADINLKQSTSTLTRLPMCKTTGAAKDCRLFVSTVYVCCLFVVADVFY